MEKMNGKLVTFTGIIVLAGAFGGNFPVFCFGSRNLSIFRRGG